MLSELILQAKHPATSGIFFALQLWEKYVFKKTIPFYLPSMSHLRILPNFRKSIGFSIKNPKIWLQKGNFNKHDHFISGFYIKFAAFPNF